MIITYRTMTEREMFERSFQRPSDYFKLNSEEQHEIDKWLGILDWDISGLNKADKERYLAYYSND